AGTGAAGASVGIDELEPATSAEAMLAQACGAAQEAQAAGGGQIVKAGPHALQADGLVIPDSNGNGAPGPRHDAIEALVVTLTERDGYTGEHSEAVVAMSGAVARNLGLRDTEVEWVRSAALLHDIGKVAIPDEILHKPGPLDDEEWVLMKQHPVIGERILSVLPGMGPVARIVRHEHERWDGGG